MMLYRATRGVLVLVLLSLAVAGGCRPQEPWDRKGAAEAALADEIREVKSWGPAEDDWKEGLLARLNEAYQHLEKGSRPFVISARVSSPYHWQFPGEKTRYWLQLKWVQAVPEDMTGIVLLQDDGSRFRIPILANIILMDRNRDVPLFRRCYAGLLLVEEGLPAVQIKPEKPQLQEPPWSAADDVLVLNKDMLLSGLQIAVYGPSGIESEFVPLLVQEPYKSWIQSGVSDSEMP